MNHMNNYFEDFKEVAGGKKLFWMTAMTFANGLSVHTKVMG